MTTSGCSRGNAGWTLRAALARIARQECGSVLRTHGIGAQILHDLGITRMRVPSAPRQPRGITAFGLEITGYED